jgi:tetratricopeptide (TPR) repeat protein
MNARTRIATSLAVFGLLAAVLLLGSCESVAEADPYDFETAALYGMIYGYDQNPVEGAQLVVDGEPGPLSDLDGRFVIPGLARGTHTIEVTKDGHEPATVQVEFLNLTQVLYLRLWSLHELVKRGEEALASGHLSEAAQWTERALQIDPELAELRYLQAVIAIRDRRPAEAEAILRGLVADGFGYPKVHLTLADLYQYELDQPDSAAEHLRSYLRQHSDEGAEERLEALEQTFE